MKNKNAKIPALALAAIVLIALPVFADSTSTKVESRGGLLGNLRGELQLKLGVHAENRDDRSSSTSTSTRDHGKDGKNATSTAAQITGLKSRAATEIQRRIDALGAANTAITASVRLPAATKTILTNAIQAQISSLTTLGAKIAADTDATVLKADVKSITQSYRIFLLVLPQTRITASADVEQNVASLMTIVSSKLETRIATAHTAGKDTTAVSASLSDVRAKIGDANTQSAAAVALVVNLTADNGDSVKATANAQALKDARAKIQLAASDLKTARTEMGTIVTSLKSFGV
jgi:hypothetical protein